MQTIVTEAEEARYAELQSMALDFARNGETEPLASMLDAGLPVNLSDAKGNSLLMLASYNGQLETTRMLLQYGADVDRPGGQVLAAPERRQSPGVEVVVDLLDGQGVAEGLDGGLVLLGLGLGQELRIHLLELEPFAVDGGLQVVGGGLHAV